MTTRRQPRRRARTVCLVAALTLVLGACADGDPTATEPEAEPDTTPTEALEPEPEELEDPEGPEDGITDEDEPEVPDEPVAGPTPDPDALDDPCGPHADRTDEAFIEVVAPVAEQQVTAGAVELIGCSNVFEATVQWTLYDGDGLELDTGFTTAECGSGCVGAFADSVPLDGAAGEPFAELHVYAESAEDGEREHLTAVPLVLG